MKTQRFIAITQHTYVYVETSGYRVGGMDDLGDLYADCRYMLY